MVPPWPTLRFPIGAFFLLLVYTYPSLQQQQQQGVQQQGVFYPNSFIPFRIHSGGLEPPIHQRQQPHRFQQTFEPFDQSGEPLPFQTPPPSLQPDKSHFRLLPYQNGGNVFGGSPSSSSSQRLHQGQQTFQRQPQFQIQHHPSIGFPSFRDEQDQRSPQSVMGFTQPGFSYIQPPPRNEPSASVRGLGSTGILTQDPRSGKLHYTFTGAAPKQHRLAADPPRGFSSSASLPEANRPQGRPPAEEHSPDEDTEDEVALIPHIPSGFSVLPTPPEQPRIPVRTRSQQQVEGGAREPRLLLGFPGSPDEVISSGPPSFVDQNLDVEEEEEEEGGKGGEVEEERRGGKGKGEGALRKKPGNRAQPGTRGNRLVPEGRRGAGRGGGKVAEVDAGDGGGKDGSQERPLLGPGGRRYKSGSGVRRLRPKAQQQQEDAAPSTFRPRGRFSGGSKRLSSRGRAPIETESIDVTTPASLYATSTLAPDAKLPPSNYDQNEHASHGVDSERGSNPESPEEEGRGEKTGVVPGESAVGADESVAGESKDGEGASETVHDQGAGETVDGEGVEGEEAGESVHGEREGEDVEGEVTGETVDGEREGEGVEGEVTGETVDGERAGENVEGEVTGETVDGEREGEGVEGEVTGETVDGEREGEVTGEIVDGEREGEGEEGEEAGEDVHGERAGEDVKGKLVGETVDGEGAIEGVEGEVAGETADGEGAVEVPDEVGSEGDTMNQKVKEGDGVLPGNVEEKEAEAMDAEVEADGHSKEIEEETVPSDGIEPNEASSEGSLAEASTERAESEGYHVITMKPSGSLVSQENFKDFVDSADIDATDTTKAPASDEAAVTDDTGTASASASKAVTMATASSADRGKSDQEATPPPVVSVVTTKSVVAATPPPDISTTEGWVIVASVQTSRSVSGARPAPENERASEASPAAAISRPPTTPLPGSTPAAALLSSTESIIDKLDRVQSELSSGFLTGGFRNKLRPLSIRGMTSVSEHTTSTTSAPSPQTAPPPPVIIRKFSPMNRRTTWSASTTPAAPTPTARKIGGARRPPSGSLVDSVQFEDDLSGLLPPGFKPRNGGKKRLNPTTTTTTTSTTTKAPELPAALGKKVVFQEVVSSLLPPGFNPSASGDADGKPRSRPPVFTAGLPPTGTGTRVANGTSSTTTEKPSALEAILSKIKFQDVSSLLPAGYAGTASEGTGPTDMSSLLPKGYKPPAESKASTEAPSGGGFDISSLLPSGYKPPKEDIGGGGNASTPSEAPTDHNTTAAPPSEGPLRVVFPSRPGGRKPTRKTTPRPSNNGPPQPKIMKGWPTRATTEFTGWPTQPTTPISVEKILEQARKAKAAVAAANAAATDPPSSTAASAGADGPSAGVSPPGAAAEEASVTTTTTTTPEPTTPGVCWERCELVGLIKLVGGSVNSSGVTATWRRELMNHHTKEWNDLADAVFNELDAVYSKSEGLRKWYKRVRIDGFREGSVVVDYVVELKEVARRVDTQELRRLFNDALGQGERVPLPEAEGSPGPQGRSLGGGPSPVGRGRVREMEVRRLGQFLVDPEFTEFKVISDEQLFSRGRGRGPGGATIGEGEELEEAVPQWAVAVIVIGLASLAFVVGFGVTVIVNRQKNAKKRREQQATPLTDEILREMGKGQPMAGGGGSFGGHPVSGGGSFGGGAGFDNYGADTDLEDLYDMDDVWNDRSHEKKRPPSNSGGIKRPSSATANSYAGSNGGITNGSRFRSPEAPGHYDSWRTEWNDYYFNAYYGGGLGGGVGGGGAASGGGMGAGAGGAGGPPSNGRRRPTPDYDTNF